jgi:hypothetical protein
VPFASSGGGSGVGSDSGTRGAAGVGVCIIRVRVNCFVEILDRAVVISLIVIGGAAVVVDDGQIFGRFMACLDKRRASGDFGVRIKLTGTCSGFLACSVPSQPSVAHAVYLRALRCGNSP